ncbi:50S ribosomal protein L10 [Gaopeijia maritima]|uniref:Large ribosomal subunit protein uL10 n=1 Tax=Gaopeijia maritima TaxID=3119007 RepID=A0ABU9E863_9BACT
MKRSDKEAFVADFRERASGALVMYLTDFSGLDVKSMTALRQTLRESGAEYVVAKNRLVQLALKDTDMPDLGDALRGPTGVVFGFEDAVSPAKALTDFAKNHGDRPVFKVGVLENQLLAPAQIDRLAKLPPKEQLLAELAGAMQAPLGALAGALEAKLQEMAGILDAYKAKKEAGE